MSQNDAPADASYSVKLVVAWLWVGIPLAWGVIETAINAARFFQ